MKNTLVGLLGRHAENPENKTNNFRGRLDMELDERGLQQAQELLEFIAGRYMIARIVSSPLLRALQTAMPIAEAFHLPIFQEGSIMPMDTGFLTGEDQDEFADVYQFFLDNPEKVIPRGESLDGAHERVGNFFEQDLKNGLLTLYMAHSSSGVILTNLVEGNRDLKPGKDFITEPGGLAELHSDKEGYKILPVFRESETKKETPA